MLSKFTKNAVHLILYKYIQSYNNNNNSNNNKLIFKSVVGVGLMISKNNQYFKKWPVGIIEIVNVVRIV